MAIGLARIFGAIRNDSCIVEANFCERILEVTYYQVSDDAFGSVFCSSKLVQNIVQVAYFAIRA